MEIEIVNNQRIKFSEYLGTHPHLYDGVELTQNEIDFLNNEFWDYEIVPVDFQTHYVQHIRKYIAQYKNMKAIEFCDKIFNITTNQTVRNIAQETTSKLNSTGSNTGNQISKSSGSNSSSSDNKEANRQLPMKTTGESSIENIVDWENGASNIGENKSTSSGSNSASSTITSNDQRLLSNLGEGTNDTDETIESVNQAAVDIITRIYNYCMQDKALSWLCDKLSSCFILCY